MQYSDRYDCVISADEGGFIEYWKPGEQFELPNDVPGLWSFKSQTDLYEFKKVRSVLFSRLRPTHENFLVKINTYMYYALPRLVIICHILPA
jgi:peptidylprolyl isomerase domain and WD repeat-containing protein 1